MTGDMIPWKVRPEVMFFELMSKSSQLSSANWGEMSAETFAKAGSFTS